MFEYQAKCQKVFNWWDHRMVATLAGTRAARFLERIDGMDEAGAQLLIAKATGNFRRGNEPGRHSKTGRI